MHHRLLDPKPVGDADVARLRRKWQQPISTAITDDNIQFCSTFRDQISFLLCRVPDVPIQQLAALFQVNPKSIADQIGKIRNPPKRIGRPYAMNPTEITAVLEFVTNAIGRNDPVTVNDCLNFLYRQFELDVLPDTFRGWLNDHTCFATVKAKPMERERMSVTIKSIEAYFDRLEAAIRDVPAAMIFNLDESGFDRYCDASSNVVILPKGCDQARYAVDRKEKRATLLAVVACDGTTAKPLVIVPRKTVDSEMICAGFTESQAVYANSDTGYISLHLFERYLEHVLIPHIWLKRHELGYEGWAVLTYDNCSCHSSDRIDELLCSNGIRQVPLPPHSSDQTQACDLGLFGNMKAAQSRIHPPEEYSTQSKQLIRMLCAFQATCHPFAVTSAFRSAGLSTTFRDGKLYATVTRWTAKYIRSPPAEWAAMKTQNRNEPVSLNDGFWGERADQLMDDLGMNVFIEEDLEMDEMAVPTEPLPPDANCHLMTEVPEFVRQFWDGELPDSDADDNQFDEDVILVRRGREHGTSSCSAQPPSGTVTTVTPMVNVPNGNIPGMTPLGMPFPMWMPWTAQTLHYGA